MYRILKADKDTYIQNKYIAGSRSLDSNVGNAGTIDLYKLYNETTIPASTSSIVEISRALIKFDYSKLQDLTGSILDFSTGSFSATVKLFDVYGGQTVPSNFTLELFPLSKSFDEGRGQDVISYRDLDAANWLTASLSPEVTWSQAGAGATGSLGEDVDVIVSGNLGYGLVPLGVTQNFNRGDENLSIDVTRLVSASLAGIIPNNGFRISFSTTEEENATTYFVKRFGTRHSFNKNLHPQLVVTYDDSIPDPGYKPFFDLSSSLYVYNIAQGLHRNFFSGSTEVVGDNSLLMELISSKSVKIITSSWSPSHSQSINYLTNSLVYFSRSYSGSQASFGSLAQIGIYKSPFNLSCVEDSELFSFVGDREEVLFDVFWKSLDSTVQYAKNNVVFRKFHGHASNVMGTNLVANITNLKHEYNSNETQRLRVFASDYNQEVPGFKVPISLKSVIIPDMRWQLIKAWTREIIIPWGAATKMSTDVDGMYFDFYFSDLETNEVYEIELLCGAGLGRDVTITNQGFRFKILP